MTESYTDFPRDFYTGYILRTWLNRTLTFHGTATQVIYYIHDWIVHWPSTGLLHRLYTTYMTESYTDLPPDCYTGYILHTWLNRTLTFHRTATQVIYYINIWLNRTLTFHGTATQVIYYINIWLNRTLTFHGTATQVIYNIYDWIVHWLSTGLLHRLYTTYMTESYTDLSWDCYTGYILHTWLNCTLTFHGTATQVIYYIHDWIVHWPFHGER